VLFFIKRLGKFLKKYCNCIKSR